MKKSLAMLLVALCILTTSVFAATTNQQYSADALNSLGLFNGTDKGYELDSQLKRSDGIAMLVRLLGKEDAAKNGKYSHPFTDVSDWLDPYVAYAYAEGLTSGTSETTYGESAMMTRAQFYTLVLRALGYTDAGETPDFTWNAPYDLAKKIGLTSSSLTNDAFTRGAAVEMFWTALNTATKENGKLLSASLVADGVFTNSELSAAAEIQKNGKSEVVVPEGYVVNPRTGNLLTYKQMIVDTVAYAYWDKHMDTDYEMSSLFQGTSILDEDGYQILNNRREIFSSPEWASSERRLYFDCSGYMSAIYNYVFGKDVRDQIPWCGISTEVMTAYAKPMNTADAVYYHFFKNTSDQAEVDQVVADMRAVLEPCDVIVYRRSTNSGHTIMYMDGGWTLESTGSSYYYGKGVDQVDEEGTITLRHVDTHWFNPESTGFLFRNKAVNEVCILRPLNLVTLAPSANSMARLDLSRLAIYKTALSRGQTVEQGQQITYTITLDNDPEGDDKSKDLTVTVTDPLPTNVTFVGATNGGFVEDGNVVFKNLDVREGTVKTLTYTVRVTGNEGDMVAHGETDVNGLKFTYHDFEIANKMTAAQQTKFKAAVNAGKPEDMTAVEWINSIYKDVLGKDFEVADGEELFDKLVTPAFDSASNLRYKVAIKEDSNVAAALVKDYISGRYIFNTSHEDIISRIRYLKEESLQFGDVLAEKDYYNRYTYYIYLGADQDLVKVTDKGVTTEETAPVLEAVLSKRLFALLRPAKM